MPIICNGSPKTGTHLLLKSIYLFGGLGYTAVHKHDPNLSNCIHIKRNPRNVLISYIRHFDKSNLTTENITKHIPIIIKEMSSYINLLSDSNVLNVSFEKLLTNSNELERISKFIDLPLIDDHFKKIWGNTPTFTNKLSNWREHWNEEINNKWIELGGVELENTFGYSDKDKQLIRCA